MLSNRIPPPPSRGGLHRAQATTFEPRTPITPAPATNLSRLIHTSGNIGDRSPRPQSPHPFTNRPILTPSNPAYGSSPQQSRSPSPDRPQSRPGSPEAAARGTPVYVYAPDGWRHVSEIQDDDLRTKLEEYPVYLFQIGLSNREGRDRYKSVMESPDGTTEVDPASETSPNRVCVHCRVKKQGGPLQVMHACKKCQRANRACAIYFEYQGVSAIGILPLPAKKEVLVRKGTW
jgi:hypothetical protein